MPKTTKGSKKYICSCLQRCKGRPREITKATYDKHAEFRQLTPSDSDVVQAHDPAASTSLIDANQDINTDLPINGAPVAAASNVRPPLPALSTGASSTESFPQLGRNLAHTQFEPADYATSSLDDSSNNDGNDPGCIDDPYPVNSDTPNHINAPFEVDVESLLENTQLADLCTTNDFIRALHSASLDDTHNSGLDTRALHRLRNPPTHTFDIKGDPDLRLSLELFLVSLRSSVASYKMARESILRRHPEDNIPSYDRMKRLIEEITGVSSISHPMCRNSCVAFTGPFSHLDECPKCKEPKICPTTKKPHQEFHTILIGPVLQALWRDPSSAQRFYYRRLKTREIITELLANSGKLSSYDDFIHGSEYLNNIKNGNITDDDIVLMFSIDGAQLYAHKASDCWIYIWVLMDFSPDERYKKIHVLPGGFIPGPNKPKNIDSFLFPGLFHLAALQREGLRIWDAFADRLFLSHPFLALNTADGPAMAYLNGLVGHHGKYGCRLYCAIPGRHKPNGSHYYPALLKPVDYVMAGCDHPDISHFTSISASPDHYFTNLRFLLESANDTQYKKRRLETGITKPTIYLGLQANRTLGIPGCFGSDIMHLGTFNLGDLFMHLWRGQLDRDPLDPISEWPWAVLQGDLWEQHGRDVVATTPYLPGSFDRPPRNIAEKINSGYKAWEWLLYLYGLAPALLYNVLPEPYYSHFCKLVRGMRIIHQHHIRSSDLVLADSLLRSFSHEFEVLYYQQKTERIHFCRQSIHALLHLASEVTRIGPPICSSQWTMERTIGNLGEEIHQPSNPYANLSQRGLFRCQMNALNAMIPDLQPHASGLPRGAIDLGHGYALFRARDRYNRLMEDCEAKALHQYLWDSHCINLDDAWCPKIARWARLRLPNGQIARSSWKEDLKPLNKVRKSRNVKVRALSSLYILKTCSS